MTTIRDLMTPDATCAAQDATLTDIARLMRDHGVGAMPVCDDTGQMTGFVTDRDIVVRCVAEGADPGAIHASDITDDSILTISADDDIDRALQAMASHGLRRLPVVNDGKLIGMVSQADIAVALSPEYAGELVSAISGAPSNN